MTERVRALRGASTSPNDAAEITAATRELLAEMLERNGASHEDLVSIVFTATPDLDAEFPAVAARDLGISDVPLLCAVEIGVTGSLPNCVRVLMHLYTERTPDRLEHVYLRSAEVLRSDLGRS
ncbi:MAG: chorismate mutase [Actinomycetota bacterium]|nr:chorismate mutase [Actinomycetota bacterium]